MADFNKPATTDTYANVIAYLNAKFSDLALGLDPANTTATNVPTNAIRWNSANNRFEKFDGTSWAIWTTTLALTNLSASGSVTLGGGTANGVPYLNGSKVLTSGSALTFDGTNLATTGSVTLNNAQYLQGKTSGGSTVRLLGINSGDTAYVGAIDAGPTSTIFNASSTSTFAAFYASGSEQMRLTSTGLGIGTSSPGVKLDTVGVMRSTFDSQSNGGATTHGLVARQSTASTKALVGGYSTSGNQIGAYLQAVNFGTAYEDLTLQPQGGNLGLGVTPSAWSNIFRVQQIGPNGTYIAGRTDTQQLNLGVNSYYASGSWLYANNGYATRFSSDSGAFTWQTAPSGTAGGTVAFTSAMTLDASGRLGIGTTSPAHQLDVANGGRLNYLQLVNAGYAGSGATTPELYSPASGTLAFACNGGERARIDSSGNFGIGTSSPGYALNVYRASGAASYIVGENGSGVKTAIGVAGDNGSLLGTLSSHNLRIVTGGAVAATVDTSGIFTATAGNLMLVSGTSQATTSGTTKDFTGIPSWVKRITINFSGVSVSGTSNLLVQLGTGSTTFTTSGYASQVVTGLASVAASNSTAGFVVSSNFVASDTASGVITINNVSGNAWVEGGTLARNGSNGASYSAGAVSLAAALTAVRITTVNGTDTFDAGSVNILYE